MKIANLLTICFFISLTAVFSAAQAIKSTPADTVEQTITIAQDLLKKGDVIGAIGVLQTALQNNPQNITVRF